MNCPLPNALKMAATSLCPYVFVQAPNSSVTPPPVPLPMQGEEVQRELVAVQRELAGVREQAQGEVRARERLAQDLQARQAQVCSLEGQLEAAHTLTSNLTKEIKR